MCRFNALFSYLDTYAARTLNIWLKGDLISDLDNTATLDRYIKDCLPPQKRPYFKLVSWSPGAGFFPIGIINKFEEEKRFRL